MSTEPTFPVDAIPGDPASDVPKVDAVPVIAAKPTGSVTAAGNNRRWQFAGVGAAIGSAAIVAALLYVNRSKQD